MFELIEVDADNVSQKIESLRVVLDIIILDQPLSFLLELPTLEECVQGAINFIGTLFRHGLTILPIPAAFLPIFLGNLLIEEAERASQPGVEE